MNIHEATRLKVEKEFPVTAAQLFEAWTRPEALQQWWHPMGNRLQHATIELQEGGRVEYVFQNEGGSHSFTIRGRYSEVKKNERLAYSWNWELSSPAIGSGEYNLSVTFSSQAKGSRLQVVQENFKEDESIQPHRDGWEKALNDLADFLSAHE